MISKIDFGVAGELFFIILFVLTGASLHLAELMRVWPAALAFILARAVGKWLPLFVGLRLSGLSINKARVPG